MLLANAIFTMVLEKAEEPEIKLPTPTGSSKKQEFEKNIYLYFIDYANAFGCVHHNKLAQNWERNMSRLYIVTLLI